MRSLLPLFAFAALAAVPFAAIASDLDQEVAFDIPAQPLSQALADFSRQADTIVGASSDTTNGKTSKPINETTTPAKALRQLLEGTKLQYKQEDDGTIIVTQPIARAGNDATAALRIAQAEGENLPAATPKDQGEGNKTEPGRTLGSPNKDLQKTLEEVIVTAQKREQNLQDIAISISALGGQRIENLGLQDMNDIMRMVPGVTFSSVGPGEGSLVIRGIATDFAAVFSNNRKETVGVYINETPVAQAHFNPDISPFDLERVEVLRGPQGTLYGSGSLSGTVRYITRKPDTAGFAAKAGADISSTRRGGINHRINAMVNVPVSETFAVRVVGYDEFNDGYIDGVGPGYRGKHADDMDKYGGRVAARWTPNSRFSADASVLVERFERQMSTMDNENSVMAALHGIQVGPYEQYSDATEFLRQEANLYNLTLDYDLGWADLISSSSYFERPKVNFGTDQTATLFANLGTAVPALDILFQEFRDFSQEIRIATTLDGPLNFIGGVFYLTQDKKQFEPTVAPGIDAAFLIPVFGVDSTFYGTPPDTIHQGNAKLEDRQVAVFGELTYEITEKLSATAGLRWFDVEQDYFIDTKGFVASGNPPLNRSSGESDINPKFMVSYAFSDDVLVSAQAARGFRLGGTNDFIPVSFCEADLVARGLTGAPVSFQSESIWNYEINAKTAWHENRLVVNGGVYFIDYEDIQISTSLPCGFDYTDNAATGESKGMELELMAMPLNGLRINMGAAYVDAELSEDVPDLNGRKGDQLPLSAKFTFNTTIDYEFPLRGEWDGFAEYNYTHSDDVVFEFGWKGNAATTAQPVGYDLHGVSVGVRTRDRWNASLYVDNLFDEDVITFESVSQGDRLRYRGAPRTFGLSVSANF